MYVLCFTASFRFDGLLRVRIAIFLLEKVSWFFECIKVRATSVIVGGGRGDEMMNSELSSSAYPVKLLKKY